MIEPIILIDKNDNEIGIEDKLVTHQKGLLHRAFSIFVFNSDYQLLLQKRAEDKYHSGGLWSNTCCSHQKPTESLDKAIHRRLKEEMGFDSKLSYLRKFHYFVNLGDGLIENEIDYIYTGFYDGVVRPNPNEVMDYKRIDLGFLKQDVDQNPKQYTYWLRKALEFF